MAGSGLLISWGEIYPGCEERALRLFKEVVAYHAKLLEDGRTSGFEPGLHWRRRAWYLRLTLRGELDLATVGTLTARLNQLKHKSDRVRLDLSQLDFMDSSDIQVLLAALRDADRTGGSWRSAVISPHRFAA